MQKRFQTVKFLTGSGNTALYVHAERKAKTTRIILKEVANSLILEEIEATGVWR